MGRLIAALVACALLVGPNGALCADHLVAPAAVQTRLDLAAAQRGRDTATLERVLSTPEAASAARALGTRLDRVRAAVPTLNDGELRDLASRAAVLSSDPAAGYYDPEVHDFVVILLVVAIVVVLIDVAGR